MFFMQFFLIVIELEGCAYASFTVLMKIYTIHLNA